MSCTPDRPGSPAPAAHRCPRCGEAFHCGAAGPAPCACSTLVLPPPLAETLRQRYSGCLCLACLQSLVAPDGSGAAEGAAPAPAP